MGRRLVRWFSAEARDLPWRRTDDPYAIWVAEVLLQQTRVEQARPYYERFLRAFPTVRDLAEAPRDRVMKVWEGAGYYSRAVRLHDAAQRIVREHGGSLPPTPEGLENLPGFGPYTSRSVAALAYGFPTVALDANGIRVLTRVFLLGGADRRRRLEELAQQALGRRPPRAFNEALMELGQRYCGARAPRCPECPVRDLCRAREELPDPGAFPPTTRRPPRPRVAAAVGILRDDEGRVLVARRPEGGLLGGLWEFPGGKLEPGEAPEEAVVREFQEEVGIATRVARSLGTVEHDYSHFHVSLHGFLLDPVSSAEVPLSSERRWATPALLRELPLPMATRKMLGCLKAAGGGRRPAPRPTRTSSRGSRSRPGRARA